MTLPAAVPSDGDGALVGGIIGGILGVLVLIGIAIIVSRRRARRGPAPEQGSVDLAPARETSNAYGSLVLVQNQQSKPKPSVYESGNIET
jgi:hypothetical protein